MSLSRRQFGYAAFAAAAFEPGVTFAIRGLCERFQL